MKKHRKQRVYVDSQKHLADVPVDDELYKADGHAEYQRARSKKKDTTLQGEILADVTVGCAVGVDTWAAEIIIRLKHQAAFSDIELFCVIPFPEHTDRFTAGQKKRYQNILNRCDNKEVISSHYSPVAYKRLIISYGDAGR